MEEDRVERMLRTLATTAKTALFTQKEDAGKRRLTAAVQQAEELLEVLRLAR